MPNGDLREKHASAVGSIFHVVGLKIDMIGRPVGLGFFLDSVPYLTLGGPWLFCNLLRPLIKILCLLAPMVIL